jgi:uncharacterized GH25 family protein
MLLLSFFCCQGFCGDSPAITGKVVDGAGKPIADATVMVYHAGPTSGYSLFCPGCYADCGKRAVTDSSGTFRFHHLSSGLWFELLVARSGYEPKFVANVVPASDVSVTATLARRTRVSDPHRIFRGRIVDSRGLAQRDAVVQLVGALWDVKTGASIYGVIQGLDPIAVTNQDGIFEIESFPVKDNWTPWASGPPVKILVSVEARGMAERFSVLPAGAEPLAVTVTDGDVVRGKLVQDGKPVGGAEIGLIAKEQGGWGPSLKMVGSPYEEIRIGTRPNGQFEIPNVPVTGNWYVYAKMESVATRGATGNVACATKHDGEIVDVGDLVVKPAHHLRGRVVLSDGKPIPNGMRVTIGSELAWDSQTAMLPPDGRFEFFGLASGDYSVFASVKGYSLAKTPISVKQKDGSITTYAPSVASPFPIDRDVNNFVITLQPEAKVKNTSDSKARRL